MHTTARTALRLLVATPIAAAAIAVGGGVAHADGFEPGPIVVAIPGDGEPTGPGGFTNPEPEPKPDPKPEGPGGFTNPEPGPKPDPKPEGPGGFTNPEPGPKPDPKPEGPGEITAGEDDGPRPDGPDDLAHPEEGDQPEDQPQDQPGDEPADEPTAEDGGKGERPDGRTDVKDVDEVGGVTEEVPVPTRIDAGSADAGEPDLGLTFGLAGGGLLAAAAALLARQRLARRQR
ncbi:hypothetical protein L615_001400000010 [Nocardioides sp. J9]|uniref:hypothetical protein n=1 Tax=Nocardioides sp. J9 TaxID=935844 RepID=UPI0011AD8CD7|nr:hypothetical protein [Nocardioides sp. J9]TWH01938.1 hypothetical protein L615_001400000010 [Nocardioides sp. J9]